MSSFARPHPRPIRYGTVLRGVLVVWHVACIGLLTGCPFLAPARTPTMNEAPRIVRPDPTDDLELLMEFEWNQVTVFARDDDNDALNFQWIAPLGAQTETSDGEDNSLQYSNFRVRRDPALHGTEVTLAVDDGSEETFVEWTLIMPGAE